MTQRRASSTTANPNDNKDCEIDNPLIHKSLERLDQEAKAFARRISTDLHDEELFVKAARIARDPPNWETVRSLTNQEREALRDERSLGFWKQPKALRQSIFTFCVSAIVQGWVQTGGNGANQGWPGQFNIADKSPPYDIPKGRDTWIFAGVNAVTYLAAGLGCWLSDPLQSTNIGRRGTIFVSGCLCLASVIGASCSEGWVALMVWRTALGLSMGLKATVTPVFAAEVSPSHLRGLLVMNWQLYDACGIFLGFTANLILYNVRGYLRWRSQMASAAIPTLILLILIWTIPDSPRWLLKRGRLSQAFESLIALRRTRLQAAVELYYANAQVQAETALLPMLANDTGVEAQANEAAANAHDAAMDNTRRSEDPEGKDGHRSENGSAGADEDTSKRCSVVLIDKITRPWRMLTERVSDADMDDFQRRVKSTSYISRFGQLFRDDRTRRATVAALVVMISQQLCGVNVLQFYSSTFFRDATPGKDEHQTSSDLNALWISWAIGLVNFLSTFPAYYYIDKRGRRFLLLASYPVMFLCMLLTSLTFNVQTHGIRWLAIIFMIAFICSYSFGQGPVPFAYSSEVFPLFIREIGMSFAVFINLFGAGILTLFVPVITQALGHQNDDTAGQARLLGIFAGLNALAFLLIFFLVPETAGAAAVSRVQGSLNYMSLEELNYIFLAPTRKHISYQCRQMLPWALAMVKYRFSRSVLRNREAERPRKPIEMHTWVSISNEQRERERAEERERELLFADSKARQ